MKKTNKELIFERMGIGVSSPKFTIQQPVKEEAPLAGNLVNDLQNLYYKYGVFPIQHMDGVTRFVNIDDNQDAFNNMISNLEDSWNESNLPY